MLEIRDLTLSYPNGVAALCGVSLTIPRGLFGLLGPNGAGKSSLMRILATLQPADSGTVTFDGADIFADPVAHRRRLGYLPQDFGVYPGMSALALLDHFAVLKGMGNAAARRQAVEEQLVRTNLWDDRRRAVSSYSGGMRQRFGIAQALLARPSLVVVDEPTAGLDPEERHRFHNLLAEIGEEVVVILSTHIVEDVRQLCSRLAIISRGEVVSEGTPGALVAGLEGRVWSATGSRREIDLLAPLAPVLSMQWFAGKLAIRVLADRAPSPRFSPVVPDLSDAYFAALNLGGGV
ncbi:MAG: ABC transporter ATP-binding protein [Gemmatimonadales bacterium]|nr:ABC transporter ATP-binding protein [Gemmatimonadales bacterium]